jgi:hypothetical protein
VLAVREFDDERFYYFVRRGSQQDGADAAQVPSNAMKVAYSAIYDPHTVRFPEQDEGVFGGRQWDIKYLARGQQRFAAWAANKDDLEDGLAGEDDSTPRETELRGQLNKIERDNHVLKEQVKRLKKWFYQRWAQRYRRWTSVDSVRAKLSRSIRRRWRRHIADPIRKHFS